MSQITVTSELVIVRDKATEELRAFEEEFVAMTRRLSSMEVEIPIEAVDNVTPTIESLRAEVAAGDPLEMSIEAVDSITPEIDGIRQAEQTRPIVVPVTADDEPGSSSGGSNGLLGRFAMIRAAIAGVSAGIDFARIGMAAWNGDTDAQVKAAGDLQKTIERLPFGIGEMAVPMGAMINNLITSGQFADALKGDFSDMGLGVGDYVEKMKQETAETGKAYEAHG